MHNHILTRCFWKLAALFSQTEILEILFKFGGQNGKSCVHLGNIGKNEAPPNIKEIFEV